VVDHEIWTLGEAFPGPGAPQLSFLSKEVWLDKTSAGRVTCVIVWESLAAWQAIGSPAIQQRLQAEFNARFPYKWALIEHNTFYDLRRWSRFERTDQRKRR
jgi:hypothetical protein